MAPEFIQTKYFTIHTLWIFFAAALVVGTYAFIKLSVRNGLKIQFISEHSFWIILWGLIGARVLSLILNYKTYFYEFSFEALIKVLYIWDKGLSLTGALIALIVYLFYICKKHEQNFWKWIDVLVPSILFALSIGYIGTFFEGTNYGKPTSLPWGVNFESSQIKYTIPIHPTQIYSFLYTLAIAVGLILVSRLEKITNLKKAGFIGLVGIIAYFFVNFLEHFLRGDDTYLLFGIRLPQIISLLIAITAGIFLYFHYNKPEKSNKMTKTPWNT